MVARADRYRKVGLFNGIFAPAVNLRAGRQVPRAGSFVVVRAAAGDAVNCHTSIGAGVVRGLEGAAAPGRGARGKSLLSWLRARSLRAEASVGSLAAAVPPASCRGPFDKLRASSSSGGLGECERDGSL